MSWVIIIIIILITIVVITIRIIQWCRILFSGNDNTVPILELVWLSTYNA